MSSSVNVTEYLFHRLYQLGIRALHGVPGDFNLHALDYVEQCGLQWVGNANELNAGQSYRHYLQVSEIDLSQAMLPMDMRESKASEQL